MPACRMMQLLLLKACSDVAFDRHRHVACRCWQRQSGQDLVTQGGVEVGVAGWFGQLNPGDVSLRIDPYLAPDLKGFVASPGVRSHRGLESALNCICIGCPAGAVQFVRIGLSRIFRTAEVERWWLVGRPMARFVGERFADRRRWRQVIVRRGLAGILRPRRQARQPAQCQQPDGKRELPAPRPNPGRRGSGLADSQVRRRHAHRWPTSIGFSTLDDRDGNNPQNETSLAAHTNLGSSTATASPTRISPSATTSA